VVTIKDGVKIGFGLLLFKWLLGLGGCVATIGFLVCVSSMSDSQKKPNYKSSPTTRASSNLSTGIAVWRKKCNIRNGPGTGYKVVGTVRPGVKYVISDRRGKWRLVSIAAGNGWVGCRPSRIGR